MPWLLRSKEEGKQKHRGKIKTTTALVPVLSFLQALYPVRGKVPLSFHKIKMKIKVLPEFQVVACFADKQTLAKATETGRNSYLDT